MTVKKLFLLALLVLVTLPLHAHAQMESPAEHANINQFARVTSIETCLADLSAESRARLQKSSTPYRDCLRMRKEEKSGRLKAGDAPPAQTDGGFFRVAPLVSPTPDDETPIVAKPRARKPSAEERRRRSEAMVKNAYEKRPRTPPAPKKNTPVEKGIFGSAADYGSVNP